MKTAAPGATELLSVRSVRAVRRAASWSRENLFNTWYNGLLTVGALWLISRSVTGLLNWGVLGAVFQGTTSLPCRGIEGACWPVISQMWQVFMVGTYPFEERWRTLATVLVVGAVALAGVWAPLRRRWLYVALWALVPVAAFALIRGGLALPVVESSLWGGLLLTVILSVVGIVCSFPIGVMLALGRRSKMPIIRALCVIYIELIRGVPLVTVLFMASVMLPLFFPSGFYMDKGLRAQAGIILFSAAYLAVVVRGGLQGLPRGQEEAAAALGLNYWQTMRFVVLPQALRIVIPPLVSQFISLLKDTTLVTIIGLFDLLGITTLVTSNPEWLGKIIETYVFVAVIYWIMCFAMSRYARSLEIQYSARQH